jgi:hypothetical protein
MADESNPPQRKIPTGTSLQAFGFQIGLNLLVIVNFVVEDQGHPTEDGHRLGAALQIDDGQATMPQGHFGRKVASFSIGSPVVHCG